MLDTPLSDCCCAPALGETDICSDCREHAEFMTDEEWEELEKERER